MRSSEMVGDITKKDSFHLAVARINIAPQPSFYCIALTTYITAKYITFNVLPVNELCHRVALEIHSIFGPMKQAERRARRRYHLFNDLQLKTKKR